MMMSMIEEMVIVEVIMIMIVILRETERKVQSILQSKLTNLIMEAAMSRNLTFGQVMTVCRIDAITT